MMVAEKAADLIKGKNPLPANNAPFYRAGQDMPLYAEGEERRDHVEAPSSWE